MKTTAISLALVLLAGSLVIPVGLSEAQVVNQTVPLAPTNLSATAVSSSQINLSWTAPVNSTSSDVNGYRIQRNGTTLVNNTGTTQTSYTDTGLLAVHQQTYRVAAWNSAG
ncbi:MAG: fibronectin type III domain-containing protein, partial [Nitrosopumilaceae archaeon]